MNNNNNNDNNNNNNNALFPSAMPTAQKTEFESAMRVSQAFMTCNMALYGLSVSERTQVLSALAGANQTINVKTGLLITRSLTPSGLAPMEHKGSNGTRAPKKEKEKVSKNKKKDEVLSSLGRQVHELTGKIKLAVANGDEESAEELRKTRSMVLSEIKSFKAQKKSQEASGKASGGITASASTKSPL